MTTNDNISDADFVENPDAELKNLAFLVYIFARFWLCDRWPRMDRRGDGQLHKN